MAEPKTKPTGASVDEYLASVDEPRRSQAQAVRTLMERVTGAPAAMWGPSMLGFGSATYRNTSGEHDWFVVGLSPRKAALTLYGLYNDYGPPDPLFDELGPHTTGKGCLYLAKLEGVDLGVLEQLVRQAWDRGCRTPPPS
jgi:hypothetical protein